MLTSKQLINILYDMREDQKFVIFQEKVIKTKLKIIGVKIPQLRKFAKDCFKNNIQIDFDIEADKYFECVVLEGFLIALEQSKEIVKLKLEKYFKKMDNWAVVDMVCSSLICFKRKQTRDDFDYFSKLIKSNDIFTVRFGIVCFLKFFSECEHADKVLRVIKDIKCGEYYVDMAIAWLISEIIIKNMQNAEKIIKKVALINSFNTFIVNKSVDKVCDSYRVGAKIKEKLKEFKINVREKSRVGS